MSLLPLKTEISDTYPNPSNDVARVGFGKLWEAVNEALEKDEIDIASATTTDIGAAASTKLRITGTVSPITSLGSTYRGPFILRVETGPHTFTHNATTLRCPGGVDLVVYANDVLVISPVASSSGTFDGWQIAVLSRGIAPRVTIASAASTAEIWKDASKDIDWTGTVTCTGFPNAPYAGAERTLICAAAAPFTADANMLIDGTASASTITLAANDEVTVRAISTSQFRLTVKKYNGASIAGGPFATKSEVETGVSTLLSPSVDSMRQGFTVRTTEATTSGTSKEVTGIPSWVTQIVITLNGVGTNGTNNLLFRIGDSGGYETTGYTSQSTITNGTGFPAVSFNTTGFLLATNSNPLYGVLTLDLHGDIGSFTWGISGIFSRAATSSMTSSGIKTLSAALDRIQILPAASDSFDAGAWGVAYR